MRKLFYFYFVLVLTFLNSCKERSSDEERLQQTLASLDLKKYTKHELETDFDLLVNSLTEAHTGLYWYSTKKQFDSISSIQKAKLKDNLNGLEFYNIIAPIVAFTKEDHCDIYLSDELSNFMDKKGKYLPLAVVNLQEKVYVLNSLDSTTLINGFELKAINDMAIEDVYSVLFNTFASDGYIRTSKYRWLDNIRLTRLYARSIGQPATFHLEIVNPKTGETHNLEVAAIKNEELSRIGKHVSDDQDMKPAEFTILENGTGLLTLNTFSNKEYAEAGIDFKSFISSSFQKIDSLEIKDLIIDLRENGGGTEGNEDFVFSFLTDKSYRKYKYVEASAFTFSFFNHTDYSDPEEQAEFVNDLKEEHSLSDDGRILRKEGIEEPEPLKPNPFKENVYVLTSGWTYSGGAEFSSLMRQYTDAVFIGEETGGGFYGNTSGYSLELTLPNTGISVDIPILKFALNVNNGLVGRGVIPDFEIQPTVDQYLNRNDTVMKFTTKLIEESR